MSYVDEHIEWLLEKGRPVLSHADRVNVSLPPFDRRVPKELQEFADSPLSRQLVDIGVFNAEGNAFAKWGADTGLALLDQDQHEQLVLQSKIGRFPIDPIVFFNQSQEHELVMEGSGQREGWVFYHRWTMVRCGPVSASWSQFLRASRELFDAGVLWFDQGVTTGPVGLNARLPGTSWPPDDTPGMLMGISRQTTGEARSTDVSVLPGSFLDLCPWYEPVHLI